MKTIAILFVTLIISMNSIGQTQVFTPTLSDFPDLRADTLKKYEALTKEYLRIVENKINFDSLTPAQQLIVEDETRYAMGPYFTGEVGCSWYCGAITGAMASSSQLDSTKDINYKPGNLHDFDLRTAWVEGKKGDGIGETINMELVLSPNLQLTNIDIYNGYCKSEKLWKANNRVKVFELWANGKKLGKLFLEDTYHRQRFEVGTLSADKNEKLQLSFIVLEVYKGDQHADTAISEINFDGTGDH